MPRAGRPASRRSSRSGKGRGAALAALPRGSRVGSWCATIMDRNTCPTLSSRSLRSSASRARPPSCGRLRGTAAPSASSARSRRTCSGCGPSTASKSFVRRCWPFEKPTTRPGSSNGTGFEPPRPCGRTSFHPRLWPRRIQSGVSQTEGGTAWFYATALEAYFNKGVKPQDISRKIREDGGIRALYDKALAERRKTRQRTRIMADDYLEDGAKRPNGSGLNSTPEASDDVGVDQKTSGSAPKLGGQSEWIRVR